ncbi:hypothetical protein [Deinococcus cellulosilyticus]|uniref:Uncharacterized protein n=1 Tax=Deinococcus cellulosilyticus (strain DSM 18568 / NBRC 106333 / KACC 11606 / 5516J-15) TaxID=1223518 RepID=A0A511MVM6_DEIC1|nr:hypothetical protein [Deinococcus cellulosilyticus]GEM44634.1 hypothetical protein DC3_02690 [Deinococcus cellulosilyticus NBRC 106333 = KACC 11606]
MQKNMHTPKTAMHFKALSLRKVSLICLLSLLTVATVAPVAHAEGDPPKITSGG